MANGRHTTTHAEEERIAFVRRAATWFEESRKHSSYTDDNIEPGCWLALRWGLDNDCVLVLKLDEFEEPVIYGQAIDIPEEG